MRDSKHSPTSSAQNCQPLKTFPGRKHSGSSMTQKLRTWLHPQKNSVSAAMTTTSSALMWARDRHSTSALANMATPGLKKNSAPMTTAMSHADMPSNILVASSTFAA